MFVVRVHRLIDVYRCGEMRDSIVAYVRGVSSFVFFFQAEDGIRDLVRSRGLGDVYKRQGTEVALKHIVDEALAAAPSAVEWVVVLERGSVGSVSYTHLTLPTIYSV